MNQQRLTVLLVAALLIIGAGFFLSAHRQASQGTGAGGALLPDLAAQSDSLSAITLYKGSATPSVSLHKKDGGWTIAERGDYPADLSRLRKLVLSMNDAKIVEAKTKDPANYAAIGVEDPKGAGASGVQIDYTTKQGNHSLIVGKPVGDGNFVRRGGEEQSYQAAPGIYVESESRAWIDNKLFEVPLADLTKVEVKLSGGASYSLHRAAPPAPKEAAASAASAAAPPPAENPWILDNVPAGRKSAEQFTLAPSSAALGGLTADDVAEASSLDFSKASTAVFTSKDGGAITVSGIVVGDKHWIEVSGIKDPAFATKSKGRAYEVAGYRYDGIFRPQDQLLAPKETPADKADAKKKPPKP
jgi:hypothetical protein